MDWKRYGVSAANSFISAAAGSASSGLGAIAVGVGVTQSLKIAGITAVISGAVSFLKWLNQHPIPGAEQ